MAIDRLHFEKSSCDVETLELKNDALWLEGDRYQSLGALNLIESWCFWNLHIFRLKYFNTFLSLMI